MGRSTRSIGSVQLTDSSTGSRASPPIHTRGDRRHEAEQVAEDRRMPVSIDAMTRAELVSGGMTARGIRDAVAHGELIRARRNHYLPGDAPQSVVRAARVGGRLTCLSLLQELGVFVFANNALHVHVPTYGGRLASPRSRRRRLPPRRWRRERIHWHALVRPEDATTTCVGILDALAQALRCQAPRFAIASIDSALNKRLLSPADLDDLFAALPARYDVLKPLVDGRCESGPETLVRLMLRSLGVHAEPQVVFDGIGRVDFVVDGWLVIECDSREFHDSWKQQVDDRERDLRLAGRGYPTLRLLASDILYRSDVVLAAIRGILNSRR